jgi:hypothetical protein
MSEIDEFEESVRAGDYNRASILINKFWLDTMIFLTQKNRPDLKELNYINVTVDTGDGEYILALMHTKGKKLQLQEAT